jgi:hypothetical protein
MNQLRSAQEAMNKRLMQGGPADVGGILSKIDRQETATDFYEPPNEFQAPGVPAKQIEATKTGAQLFGLGKIQPTNLSDGVAYFAIHDPAKPGENPIPFTVIEKEMTPARIAQQALIAWDKAQGEDPSTLVDDPDAFVAQAQKKPLSVIGDEEAELIKGIPQGTFEVTIPKEKLVRFKSDVLTGRAGAPVAIATYASQAGLPLGHDTYAIERPYGMVYFEAGTGKLFWKPQVSESQVVKMKRGEIEAGMNLDRMQTILEQQALGGTPEASIVDELIQNSIDAFVPGGKKEIHIAYGTDVQLGDDHQRAVLTFADTGKGMTPDDVRKHFVILAGKGKAGTTTAGGYGIAKAAFLFHPDRVQMTTVRKVGGKKTIAKFDATREEIRSGKWAFETGEVSADEDVGTKLILTFPEADEMYKIRDRVNLHVEQDRVPGVKFNIEGDPTTLTGFNYPKAYPTEKLTDEHGNRASVYFRKIKRGEHVQQSGADYEVNVGTFNHGIKMHNILSWRYNIGLSYKPDFALEINFERTAEPESDGYPFIDNRRTLNSAVMDKIIALVMLKTKALEAKGLKEDVSEWKAMYQGAAEVGGIKVLIPFKERSHRKKARAIFRDNKEVFEDFAAVSEWIGRKLKDAGLASPDMEMAITVDPNVHGSRSVPSVVGQEVYAINPFALVSQFEDPKNKAELERYAKQYGRTVSHLQAAIITHAYVHEFTHKEHYGHNEQFTSGLADYYKKLTHSELAEVENELIKIFERHAGRIETIAASLQKFSKGGSRFFTRDALAAPLQEHGTRREGAPGEVREPSAEPVEGETRFQVEDTGYPSTWPKEYTDEAFAIRDRVAKGDLDVASKEFRDLVDDLNKRWKDTNVKGAAGLRLNNLRHKPNTRFEITKEKVYGPIRKGEIGKTVTVRKKVLKQTPKGPIQVDEYYDERGRQIVPGVIFYPNKRTKMRQIGEILKKNAAALTWYRDWAQFNQSFVDAGVSRDLMEKYIKIQAITSRQKGPQANQDVFTHILNKLEQDVPLQPGRLENLGDGIEQGEITKIMEIWNNQDFWMDSLEDRIARYGPKIGAYMQLGLYPWSDSVVLDRHMAHPWGFDNAFSFGATAMKTGDWHQRGDFAVEVRDEIESDIRAAAKKFNQPVGAVQAAIWYEARLPDVQASTYKEATGLSKGMIPKEMHKVAAIPEQHAVHYSEAAREEIRGAEYGEPVPSYSKEVAARMYGKTDNWPYIPTGDFYLKETGGQPEGVVKTLKKIPHVAGLKNIYDLDRDLLGFRERAADIKYNEMRYGKQAPHASNVIAKLIQDAGYLGFARTMGAKAGKWAAVFGETPVEGPISTTLQISEVAEDFETLPQSLEELEWYAENRNPGLAQELQDLVDERYPEVTMGEHPSTFARFGNATSGKLEYGMSVEMEGPLKSIRALAAEAVGLGKHQNMVFLVGETKAMDQEDPNGTMATFRVNDSVDKATLEKKLAKHGLDEYNIKEVKGSVYFDEFVHDDMAAKKAPPIDALFRDIGVKGSMQFRDVYSEGIGDAAEGPKAWSGDIEDIRANYEKVLKEHFGKKRGGEIYAEGLKKGLLWADEGKTREHAANVGRTRGDRGPAPEGGPDAGLPQPQGPTTKAQVARKGFDPRRSLADQTISPDIVERVTTMVSAVDEAFKKANFTPTDYYNDFKVKFQPIIDLRQFKNVETSIREHGLEGKQMSAILAASTINQMNALVTFSTEQDLNTMETTAWHETWHLIEPFIPSDQLDILKKHYETGEGRADAYRDFIGGLEGRPLQHGAVRRVFRQLKRFFDLIKNALAGKGFTRPQDVFGRAFVGEFKPTGPRATRAGPVSTTALKADITTTQLQVSDTRPEGIKRLFGKRHRTFREKTNETFQAMKTKGFWDTVVTQTLDRVSPVQKAGEKAYQLKRIETGLQAVFSMVMEHGKLKWDPSGVITADEKRRGFIPFLRSLGKDWDKFFYWVAAKRAEVLETEGRERWLNKPERNEIFGWTRPSGDADWTKKAEELAEFNNNILDLAERAGLINPAGRRKWQQQYYVPFYRIFEDEEAKAEFLRAPQKNQRFISAQIKRLKGAERKLGDPLENMMHNWMHLIGESMRNVARAEAYRWSMENETGLVEPTTAGKTKYYRQSKDGKVVYAMDKTDEPVLTFQHLGKPVYFKVHDPELYNALGDINTARLDNLFVNLMRTTKRWLTYGATFGPAFRVANMLRDTLHTTMLEKSFKPFLDTAKGFLKTWREDENYVRLMASGAGFGSSYVRADDPEAAASYINRIIKKEGQGAADRILNTPKKMLDWWEKVGSASENAARVQLFANLTEEGVSGREAAFRARDLLDFTMSGEHAAVQLLIQTIPFLNARVQGLYRLGRGIKNTENRGNFALRGSLLMAASVALWGFNKDDDRYKELEDWDRWQYYHIWIGDQHFRLPKPFEVGAMFSSLPESMLDSLSDNETGKHFANFLAHTFTETFAVNVPQFFVPIIEQWANKSFFSGRPIVPERLKGLKPEEQYEPWTSEAMRTLAGGLGVSPKRAQEMVRGYFATLGELILAGTDIGFRNTFDYPERADWRLEDYPLVGRFLRDQPPRYTKQMSWFYRAMEEADRTVKTVNHFKRTGRYKEAVELQTMEKNRIRNRASLSKARTRLRKLNRRIRRINLDSALNGKQKREQLDELTEQRNQIVSKMYNLHNGEV